MTAVLKHYVEFHYPSVFPGTDLFEPTKIQEIDSRSVKNLTVPTKAFGFVFFDRQVATENGIEMMSAPINVSSMHFYAGEIVMVKNKKANTNTRMVRCRDGEIRKISKGDIIVMLPSKKGKEK